MIVTGKMSLQTTILTIIYILADHSAQHCYAIYHAYEMN